MNKHQQRIHDTNRRNASIAKIESEVEEPVDPQLLKAFADMDPTLLERIQKLVAQARSDGWNEGTRDTERQYEERM